MNTKDISVKTDVSATVRAFVENDTRAMVCSAGYGLIPYRKSIKLELIKKTF